MTAEPKAVAPTAAVARVTASGPGSNAEAAGVADRIARGVELGAQSMAMAWGTEGADRIPRLRLRLPAGADEAEIAEAFARTLADARRRGR